MIEDISDYTISYLKSKGIKHEIHEFPSGCIMIDIWFDDEFYVVQIEKSFAGFSHVTTEADGFSIIPDFRFTDLGTFNLTSK